MNMCIRKDSFIEPQILMNERRDRRSYSAVCLLDAQSETSDEPN